MSDTYDVFVSHNRVNKPWVRELVKFLRARGLRVFFDEDSIPFGASIVQAIEVALEASSQVLLVISPGAVNSRWVALESSLAVYFDLDAKARRVIPLLLEPTELGKVKATVRRLNMVDLTDEGRAPAALRKLLSELGVQNVESVVIDGLVPRPQHLRTTKEQSLFRFRQPASEWYVERREQELISAILIRNEPRAANLLLTGKTGVGKSSLLNWIAGKAREHGQIVLKCTPLSDRIRELLDDLTNQALTALEGLEVQAPAFGVSRVRIVTLL